MRTAKQNVFTLNQLGRFLALLASLLLAAVPASAVVYPLGTSQNPAAYTLPDGSVLSLCFSNKKEDGGDRKSLHCPLCTLTDHFKFAPPTDKKQGKFQQQIEIIYFDIPSKSTNPQAQMEFQPRAPPNTI